MSHEFYLDNNNKAKHNEVNQQPQNFLRAPKSFYVGYISSC